MARKKDHTVVQTSPYGRPGDVVKLDPEDSTVTTFVRKGLLVEGKGEVRPLPTSVPPVEPETVLEPEVEPEVEPEPEPEGDPEEKPDPEDEPEEKPARKPRARKATT